MTRLTSEIHFARLTHRLARIHLGCWMKNYWEFGRRTSKVDYKQSSSLWLWFSPLYELTTLQESSIKVYYILLIQTSWRNTCIKSVTFNWSTREFCDIYGERKTFAHVMKPLTVCVTRMTTWVIDCKRESVRPGTEMWASVSDDLLFSPFGLSLIFILL